MLGSKPWRTVMMQLDCWRCWRKWLSRPVESSTHTGRCRMSWDVSRQSIKDQVSQCPTATRGSLPPPKSLEHSGVSFVLWNCSNHWCRISRQEDGTWQCVVNDLPGWSGQEEVWSYAWRVEQLTPSKEGQLPDIRWGCSCAVVSLSGSPVWCPQCDGRQHRT